MEPRTQICGLSGGLILTHTHLLMLGFEHVGLPQREATGPPHGNRLPCELDSSLPTPRCIPRFHKVLRWGFLGKDRPADRLTRGHRTKVASKREGREGCRPSGFLQTQRVPMILMTTQSS